MGRRIDANRVQGIEARAKATTDISQEAQSDRDLETRGARGLGYWARSGVCTHSVELT